MSRSHAPGLRFVFRILWALPILAALLVPSGSRAGDKEVPEKPEKLILGEMLGEFGTQGMKWKENWHADNAATLTDAARQSLKVATNPELSRKRLKAEIYWGKEAVKAAPRNLDIGRHDLVKHMIATACKRANERLAAAKLSPLERATAVNSGGTGDFTRDIDVTLFGGDPVREQYLFEELNAVAKELGLKPDPRTDPKIGVNLPEIDVALHRGNNDLPDARFASDVQVFAADYRKVIEIQAKNPEAYFGYGFEVEVQGRRSLSFKPGQTLVQEFDCPPGQPVKYTGQIASCQREVRAILRGSIGQRYRRSQNASHITNHYLQAFRHEQGADHDPTKGALKYAGRTIESLCEYHGMKNWPELVHEDRICLLKTLFPAGYGKTPAEMHTLEDMERAVEVGYLTFTTKEIPGKVLGKEVENSTQEADMCLHFMQKAVAATASAVAVEMLEPPSFDPKFLAEVASRQGKSWELMNAEERSELALRTDENYRKCCSVAAMENLLCIVQQVRQLDLPEYNNKGTTPGKEALQQMLETADEKTRPLLELAIEHAEAAVALDTATEPVRRKEAEARLKACRQKMQEVTGVKSAGEGVIEKAERTTPDAYLSLAKGGKPSPLGEGIAELRERFAEHLEEAFPPTDLKAFREYVKKVGVTNYVANRLVHEVASPATALDLITLIEIHQNGGGRVELAKAAGTSLVNRGSWALGFLIQAAEVKTKKDLCELGKNVVFDAFSRLVPGVGEIKIAFDIEKGLVNITVGYAIAQLNADLVDALYTGEAGRLNDGTAGRVAGRIRDSGFCVLDGGFVQKETDEKTGAVSIAIDRPSLYIQSFRKFTGRDYDDRTTFINMPGPGVLVSAHDTLIRLLHDQGSSEEPGWFGEARTIRPSERMLDRAMSEYYKALESFTRPAVEKVLAESAVRQHIQDGRDVIEEMLVARYTQDLLLGTMSAWQLKQLERVQARREVENTANFADMNQMAAAIQKSLKPKDSGEKADYSIEIGIDGAEMTDDLDGSAPIPFRFVLHCTGEASANVADVAFVVDPGPMSPPADGVEYKSQEKVRQRFTVRAMAGETTALAETTFEITVVLATKKEGLKLLEYVGKYEDGKVYQRFTYYDAKLLADPKYKPPVEVETEGGKVIHGKYQEFDKQGRLAEETNYSYGHKDGISRQFEDGVLAAETVFKMGKQALFTSFYPDGAKRFSMEYGADGGLTAQTTYWGEGELVLERATYRRMAGADSGRLEGTFVAYWKSGEVWMKSDFRDADIMATVTRDNIESSRSGPWVLNYRNGQPAERGQVEKHVMVGKWTFSDEKGRPTAAKVFDEKGETIEGESWVYWENEKPKGHTHEKGGKKVGEWTTNFENGNLESKATYGDDVLDGPWAEGFENGTVKRSGGYLNGVPNGPWTDRYENGALYIESNYAQGKRDGAYRQLNADGTPGVEGRYLGGKEDGAWAWHTEKGVLSRTGSYRNGLAEGIWVEYDAAGKKDRWTEYKAGEEVRSGRFEEKKK